MTIPELKELLFNLTSIEVKALARHLGVKPKRDKELMVNQITEQFEVNVVLEKLGIPVNTGSEENALQIARKNLKQTRWRFALAIIVIMTPTVAAFYYSYYVSTPHERTTTPQPTKADILLNVSNVCIETEHYAEAAEYLTQVINLEPNIASHYTLRAFAYLNLNLSKEAEADFAKARELDSLQKLNQ